MRGPCSLKLWGPNPRKLQQGTQKRFIFNILLILVCVFYLPIQYQSHSDPVWCKVTVGFRGAAPASNDFTVSEDEWHWQDQY